MVHCHRLRLNGVIRLQKVFCSAHVWNGALVLYLGQKVQRIGATTFAATLARRAEENTHSIPASSSIPRASQKLQAERIHKCNVFGPKDLAAAQPCWKSRQQRWRETSVTATERSKESGVSGNRVELRAGLYLVATPIGNLEDITLRALRTLEQADLILAEDTRHSAKMLNFYGIKTSMISFNEHQEAQKMGKVLERLREGSAVAVISDAGSTLLELLAKVAKARLPYERTVSTLKSFGKPDAQHLCDRLLLIVNSLSKFKAPQVYKILPATGTPLVSDPGVRLVKATIDEGFPVFPVPGPSAVLSALSVSGLPAQPVMFCGFLPPKPSARIAAIEKVQGVIATLVFFMPPHKAQATLRDFQQVLGGSRQCAVARELTKLHEEVWRGSIDEACREFSERELKGEFTIVIEGVAEEDPEEVTEEAIKQNLKKCIEEGSLPSAAARIVAADLRISRNRVYSLASQLHQEDA